MYMSLSMLQVSGLVPMLTAGQPHSSILRPAAATLSQEAQLMFGARNLPFAALNDQGWKPLGLCTRLADQPCYEITYKASNNDSSKYKTRTSNNSSD